MNLTEQQRGWLYRGVLVLVAVGLILGFVTEEEVIAWVSTVGALASSGLASLFTSTKPVPAPPDNPDVLPGETGLTAVELIVVVLVAAAVVFLVLLATDVINVK